MEAVSAEIGETVKWSSPFFEYRGRPLAMMAGFKAHAAFGFWRHAEVAGDRAAATGAMGEFGRLTRVEDLPPPEAFAALVRNAMALTEAGPAPRARTHARPAPATPAELVAAFPANKAMADFWEGLPPSAQRDYAQWIEGAKRPETRARRLETTLAQLAEGKRLNWKYGG